MYGELISGEGFVEAISDWDEIDFGLINCDEMFVRLIVIVWLDNELNCLIVWLRFGNPIVMIEIVNYVKSPRKEKRENWNEWY